MKIQTQQQKRITIMRLIDEFETYNPNLTGREWRENFAHLLGIPPESLIGIIKNNGGHSRFDPANHIDDLIKLQEEHQKPVETARVVQPNLFNQ